MESSAYPELPRHVLATEERSDGTWELWVAEGPGPRELVLGETGGHGEVASVGRRIALGAFGQWGYGRRRDANSQQADASGLVTSLAAEVHLILSDRGVFQATLVRVPEELLPGLQAFFVELPYDRPLIRAEAWSAHGYLLGTAAVRR